MILSLLLLHFPANPPKKNNNLKKKYYSKRKVEEITNNINVYYVK